MASANGGFFVDGCKDGILAYSTGGGVCNIGDEALPGNIEANHPMWTQNLYRLKDNRFEQIGMSWVKHNPWTVENQSCSGSGCDISCPCRQQEPPASCQQGAVLHPGCADVYNCQNGVQTSLGPRSLINPTTGEWPVGGTDTRCNATSAIDCRLQVSKAVLDQGGSAQFFLEQQVITSNDDETTLATRNNNASYKEETIGTCSEAQCNLDPQFPNNCDGLQPCEGENCSCPGTVNTCAAGQPCCLSPDGPCVETTQACCEEQGGWFFGWPPGGTCKPSTCSQINGPQP